MNAALQRAETIIERAPESGLVVELGFLTGNMMMQALSRRPDVSWVAVDNWLPMEEQPERYFLTKDDHAMKDKNQCARDREMAYLRASTHKASVLHMSTKDAAKFVADGSCDVVFIDADHSYEGAKEDIQNWLPKVKKGGWIGGHDYLNPDPRFEGVDLAVDELFTGEVLRDQNFTWWAKV